MVGLVFPVPVFVFTPRLVVVVVVIVVIVVVVVIFVIPVIPVINAFVMVS